MLPKPSSWRKSERPGECTYSGLSYCDSVCCVPTIHMEETVRPTPQNTLRNK